MASITPSLNSAKPHLSHLSPEPPAPNTPTHWRKRKLNNKLSPRLSPLNKSSKIINIGKRRKLNWTNDETKIFLAVYAKWEKKLRTHSKKNSVWDAILKQYYLLCKQYRVESSRTTPQLKDKARYLLAEFKKISDANKSTGKKRRDFKYYDGMMNILGDRECVVPTDFAESSDVSAGTSSSTRTRNSSSSNH